ncbi:RICIN domain-containing protein [Mesorhizobium sp. VK24D]|uniref:RICIN domain-containing protein n=1 Tax=Mesorhizobium album TaxID=3072314 RepID=A0ABU4Y565_9HYPH|nr:RICIN domain-containing protein [Mesorhizobium sp. VK24D]MDX8482087.1 RICIN domain-containing protein [Mesorhizobium sp. VK24D]
MDRIARSLLLLLALFWVSAVAPARAEEPRVVLFEDPTLNATRLHYPLLISEGRGYRIRCDHQADEEAVIRGLGFATVPSQVLSAVDNAVVAADPTANPLLCPSGENYPIKVFAHDAGSGLVYYLQFPTDFGSTSFSDQLYIPGCAPLVAELKLNLNQAIDADPSPFFAGKIHTIACVAGAPVAGRPPTFASWCIKDDLDPAQRATVEELLDLTPGGASALGNAAGCASAQDFLASSTTLDLAGRRLTNLEPLATLTHLSSLTLSDNEISDTRDLEKLTELTFLDLSRNKINNINVVAALKKLTDADLSFNQIADLRPLASARALTRLVLANNKITDVSPLRFLQDLATLDLSKNRIADARALMDLTKLTAPNLRANRLATVQSVSGILRYNPALDGNPVCISRPEQSTAASGKIFEACITGIKEADVVLANMQTGKCLAVAEGRLDNNAPAVQFNCDGDRWRRWKLVEADDGFQLQNVQTGKCLTIAGGVSTDNNVPALQFDCDQDASRRWKLTATGDGFQAENVQTAKCLTIAGGVRTDDDIPALQFNCDRDPSRFWSIRAADPEVVLVNRQTQKCLSVAEGRTDNNAPTVQFDCDGSQWQRWRLAETADGFQVANVQTGKCLTIAGGVSTENNVPALQFNCDSDPSRRWNLVETADGVQAENVQTGKCLTIAGGVSNLNNIPALQFTCDRDPSRYWTIKAQER